MVFTVLLQGVVFTILPQGVIFTMLPHEVVFNVIPQGVISTILQQGVVSYLRSISIGRVVSRRATNLRTLLSSPFLKEEGKKKFSGTVKEFRKKKNRKINEELHTCPYYR